MAARRSETPAEEPAPLGQLTLGEMIRRKRRTELKASQTDLAQVFGVDQSRIAKWEGDDGVPMHRIKDVADWLGITLEDAFRLNAKDAAPTAPGAAVERELAKLTQRVDGLESMLLDLRALLLADDAEAPRPAAKKTAAAKKAPAKRASAAPRPAPATRRPAAKAGPRARSTR